MVTAVLVAVAASTLVVLVVMLVSLSRQVVRLAGAVADFQQQVQPILEEIRRESERAGGRMEGLQPGRAGRRVTG